MPDLLTIYWLFLLLGMILVAIGAKTGILKQFLLYGKALLRVNNNNNNKSRQANNNNKPHWFWSIYYLPKRWFSHFYLIAFGSFSLALAYALFQYTDTSFKRRYSHLLNLNYVFAKLTHERIKDVHTVTSNIFAIMLMLFQVTRRLYECLFVSVFSDSGKINILHYTFGCSFYVFAALSLVCPITVEPNPDITIQLILANLVTIGRSLAFIVFVYASLVQHKCHIILANLRKDKSGRVITDQHFVPSGYLFEFITCPHFLAEIVIYNSIYWVLNYKNTYWLLCYLVVLLNLTVSAVVQHQWYKTKYKEYPKNRKAILPLIL